LLHDLALIRTESLPELQELVTQPTESVGAADLAPARVIPRDEVTADQRAIGETLIAEGRVAPFTVAGGQGTRLGFDGPKGAFPISPVRDKPLFQLFAESIRATERRYGCRLPWYIMTSPANHAETVKFFRSHAYFGLDAERVI